MISEQAAVLIARLGIERIRGMGHSCWINDLTAYSRGILFGIEVALFSSESEWIVQGWSNEAQFLAYDYMRGQ